MAAANICLLLVFLVLFSTSTSSADNRSHQDKLIPGDCSLQSCKHDPIVAALAEKSSVAVVFVARSEYEQSSATFALKFEVEYENSAMKQPMPLDIKLLTMDKGENQKSRLRLVLVALVE